MVQVEYDQKADAMYIWLRKAKYDISEDRAENAGLPTRTSGSTTTLSESSSIQKTAMQFI